MTNDQTSNVTEQLMTKRLIFPIILLAEARNLAQDARNLLQDARNLSQDARNLSQDARNLSQDARTTISVS